MKERAKKVKKCPDRAPLLATLSCLVSLLESWPRSGRQSLERRRMTRCLTTSHKIKISQMMRSREHRSQAGASRVLWTKQGSKLRPRRSKSSSNSRIRAKAKRKTRRVRRRKLVQMAARMKEMKIFMTTISRLEVTKMTMAARMVRIM